MGMAVLGGGLGRDMGRKPCGFMKRYKDQDIENKQDRSHLQDDMSLGFLGRTGAMGTSCAVAIDPVSVPDRTPAKRKDKP